MLSMRACQGMLSALREPGCIMGNLGMPVPGYLYASRSCPCYACCDPGRLL